ncbi:MAG: hypothetical protein JWN38_1168 [Candidatus Saccharibacteria bacterium]|nr:hypothetical protein [Candidatus Saccharibacteria bacterium]
MFRKKQTPPAGRQRPDRARNMAAFSYYARRSEQTHAGERQSVNAEPRLPSRRQRATDTRTLIMIGLAVCVLILLLGTSLTTNPKVIVQDSSGSQAVLRGSSDYQRAAQQLIDSSILNKNKVTIDTTAISSQLQAQFPELASVQLVLPFIGRQPTLYLRADDPVLILGTSTGSFALDRNGTALATGAQLAQLSSLKLPLVTDESGITVKLHAQALTASNVSFIRNIISQLALKSMPVATLTLPAGVSELDVRLTGQPYLIKFNLMTNTARQQAGTFLAVIQRLKEQGITPAEYVDVRVDGRAYYK